MENEIKKINTKAIQLDLQFSEEKTKIMICTRKKKTGKFYAKATE
jgi:hypothetical protein